MSYRIVLSCLLLLGLIATSFAQPQGPDTLWTHEYREFNRFFPWSIFTTRDSGVCFSGTISSQNGDSIDGGIVKLNAQGSVEWSRFVGTPYTLDYIMDAIPTSDGGSVLVGTIIGTDSGGMIAYKVNVNGDSLWCTVLMLESEAPWITTGVETRTGDLALAGQLHGGPVIVWLSAEGQLLHYRVGPAFDRWGLQVKDLIETDQGHLVLVGRVATWDSTLTYYPGSMCFTAAGDTLWTRMYTQPDILPSSSFQSAVAEHGDSILIVGSYSNGIILQTALFEVGPMGDILRWHFYNIANLTPAGGPTPVIIMHDSHSGFIISRIAYHSNYPGEGLLFKIDSEYNLLWYTIVTGAWNDWSHDYEVQFVTLNPAGGYFLALGTSHATTVVSLAADSTATISEQHSSLAQTFQIGEAYPNPFNPTTTIALTLPHTTRARLAVYDLLGREVAVLQDGMLNAGEHAFTFDGSELPSGVYLARWQAGGFAGTQKLLLLK